MAVPKKSVSAPKQSSEKQTKELPFFVEGGLINDRSGKATEKIRQNIRQQPPIKPQASDPIDEGVMRIARMTSAAGFGMLSVEEITQILGQVQPPDILPGVRPPKDDPRALEYQLTSMLDQQLNDTPGDEDRVPKPEGFLYQHGTDKSGSTKSLGGVMHPGGFLPKMQGPRRAPFLENV